MADIDPAVQRTVEFLDVKDQIDRLRSETSCTLANFGSGFGTLFERLDRLEQTVQAGLSNIYAQNEAKSSAGSTTTGQIVSSPSDKSWDTVRYTSSPLPL